MNTRITVLVNNSVRQPKLLAEHGFSLYIESHKKILFDTGQGRTLLHNAEVLGIDLVDLDYVILSHGHYDHTGGLYPLLGETQHRLPVYLHEDVFTNKIALDSSGGKETVERYIGIAHTSQEYESCGADFHFVHSYTVIDNDVATVSDITHPHGWQSNDSRLQVKDPHGSLSPDPFRDDLSLLLETDSGPVILLGCAHAGIIEIVDTISHVSGYNKFFAIIGGSHLAKASRPYIERAVQMLRSYTFDVIALTHCTGCEVEALLQQSFPGIFVPVYAGTQFVF
jgi:7,8-dihydropterin-6-yl-methyl-4-(beta-D-ribofuranosyl)aminobenzene 5'-phosphate synthase